ncbi:MAG: tetratricopeptide repeat protein [Candidatus Schekmanbacteria bacterium]|nr:tetratricopeptide repeat protein [Candidatus Schekmanbacteria bacterium]
MLRPLALVRGDRDMVEQPRLIGAFRVLGELGRGGMSVVYRAQHAGTGEIVALKTVGVPDPELLAGIRREIRGLTRLRHPGIVRVVADGVESGLPWYAMELVQGVTLRSYCDGLLDAARRGARPSSSGRRRGTPTQRLGGAPQRPEHALAPVDSATDAVSSTPTTPCAPDTAARRQAGATAPGQVASDARANLATASDIRRIRKAPSGAARSLTPPPSSGLAAARLAILPPLLDIFRQLCSPLAYLHGEGLVHRDIKPSNVVIRPDGLPVLVDFGLVSQFAGGLGRDTLESETTVAGTVAYMAPEQIRGELVDARSDLYSLGCMLYELATGRSPFVGGAAAEILGQHLFAVPAPPSHHLPGLPRAVDELILKLLEKKPEDRFGFATDVGSALALLGARGGFAEAPSPRSYLYRSRFAGREEPLRQLAAWMGGRDVASGGIAFVGGESGIGKTRFVMELARQASQESWTVVTGECLPVSGADNSGKDSAGAPLEAFRHLFQKIADHCQVAGVVETDRMLGRRGKVLAQYDPVFLDLPGQDRFPAPPELSPVDARLRLFGDLVEILARLSQGARYLLVLDDLQWSGDLTVGLLEHLIRGGHLGLMPFVIVATYRKEEAHGALGNLLGLAGPLHQDLQSLDDEAVSAILCDMLALSSPPAVFSKFLRIHSEGNPFFVSEYLRTAIEDHVLWRDDGGRWQVPSSTDQTAARAIYEALPIPRSVRDLVSRRLAALTDESRRVLEAAAVLGRKAGLAIVRALAKLDEDAFIGALEDLCRRRVLDEGLGSELRFVHDKIHEIAYEHLDSERRMALHRAAAACLREQRGEAAGAGESEIARHHDHGGEHAEAIRAYQKAALHARSVAALSEAIALLSRAIAICRAGDSEELYGLLRQRAAALELNAEYELALADLERALELAEARGEKTASCDCLLQAASIRVQFFADQVECARGAARRAERLAVAVGHDAHRATALMVQGVARRKQSDLSAAIRLGEAARDVASETGEGTVLARTLGCLAQTHVAGTDFGRATAYLRRAAEISREAGDNAMLTGTLASLGGALALCGDFAEAERVLEEALAVQRATGDRRNMAATLQNMGALIVSRGKLPEALERFKDALAIFRGIGDESGALGAINNLALVRHEHGCLAEALAGFRRLRDEHARSDDQEGLCRALQNIGAVLADCGAFAEAVAELQACERICRRLGKSHGLAECLLELGDIDWLQSRAEAATQRWSEALGGAVKSGAMLLELTLRARLVAFGGGGSGGHAETELDTLLQRCGGLDAIDVSTEIRVVAAEAKLGWAADGAELDAVLGLLEEARQSMVYRGAGRRVHRVEWLRSLTLARLGRRDEARIARRAAAAAVQRLLGEIAPEHQSAFLRHPHVWPIMSRA